MIHSSQETNLDTFHGRGKVEALARIINLLPELSNIEVIYSAPGEPCVTGIFQRVHPSNAIEISPDPDLTTFAQVLLPQYRISFTIYPPTDL